MTISTSQHSFYKSINKNSYLSIAKIEVRLSHNHFSNVGTARFWMWSIDLDSCCLNREEVERLKKKKRYEKITIRILDHVFVRTFRAFQFVFQKDKIVIIQGSGNLIFKTEQIRCTDKLTSPWTAKYSRISSFRRRHSIAKFRKIGSNKQLNNRKLVWKITKRWR